MLHFIRHEFFRSLCCAQSGNASPKVSGEQFVSMHVQVDSEAVKQACPVPFDEGRLWKGEDGEQLKKQLQAHFHNITKAMDCVGCEKCKLWGKLQILGERLSDMVELPMLCNTAQRDNHADNTCKAAPEI